MPKIAAAGREPWSPGAPKPISGPSWPRTPWDHLPVRGGRLVGQVSNEDLPRLVRAVFPDIDGLQGRQNLIEAYAAKLEPIGKAAADKAVRDFVEGKA